jgi:uracil-DNA glycosylase
MNRALSVIDNEWKDFFDENKTNLENIFEYLSDKDYYPKTKNIFRVFKLAPSKIKLVIIGQDPYINVEIVNDKEKQLKKSSLITKSKDFVEKPQAIGYSFSVPKTHKIPPSLKNIFKEINSDYPNCKFDHGNLKKWSKQGVFLINASLTVLPKKSNSHQALWKEFTNNVIKYLNNYDHIIYLLMGRDAINKKYFINNNTHKIFETVHPSPLSAYNGFFGCGVFKQINDYLEENNRDVINWQN